jgi:hypothetical protein
MDFLLEFPTFVSDKYTDQTRHASILIRKGKRKNNIRHFYILYIFCTYF